MIQAVSRTVNIKITKDDTLVNDVAHPSGATVECDEERAVYLIAHGDARLAPGANLSAAGLSRLKQLRPERPQGPPAREEVPMLRVRCVGEDRIEPVDPWGGTRVVAFSMLVGGRSMSPGEEATVREDDFLYTLAANAGNLELIDGSTLSPRALAWIERQRCRDYRPY
jgi:hypothetical protein